jgi:NAD(P)-dependent dehydrogenase (short-subunit alcohol dehydrogenase family)
MELKGRVALITGASSGIGKAAAELLAERGAKIAALSRSRDDLNELVRGIEERGGAAIAVPADVSNAADVRRAMEQTVGAFGRLDIVFANAGINGVWAPVDEIEPDEWQKTLHTNLYGTFLTVHYAVPYLRERGGAIVVTSSVNGTRIFSNTGASAYSASKAGQVAFTKMIALELAKHGIRANVICPGAIDTEIEESTEKRHVEREKEPVKFPRGKIPLTDGKPGTARQVAELVLFLVSDASHHITGTEIWIDGAESLIMG